MLLLLLYIVNTFSAAGFLTWVITMTDKGVLHIPALQISLTSFIILCAVGLPRLKAGFGIRERSQLQHDIIRQLLLLVFRIGPCWCPFWHHSNSGAYLQVQKSVEDWTQQLPNMIVNMWDIFSHFFFKERGKKNLPGLIGDSPSLQHSEWLVPDWWI